MMGSVFTWNPEIRTEIGLRTTSNTDTGEKSIGNALSIGNRGMMLSTSATLQASRIQNRIGIPVTSASQAHAEITAIMNGG
jgi:hypothetical protein